MAKIYMKRILAEIMTIDEVPARWRKQTQELLDAYYAEHAPAPAETPAEETTEE